MILQPYFVVVIVNLLLFIYLFTIYIYVGYLNYAVVV